MSSPFVFKNIIAKPSIKFPFWRINANTSVQFLKALKRLSNSQSDSSSTFGSLTGTSKWYGGVLAPNGMIYGIPINSETVLKIDPTTDTASTFGSLTGTSKWIGGVLAPNGMIYGIPYNSETVLKIDPTTDTASTFGSLTGATKWQGGVLAPNGMIYGIPRDSETVLKLLTPLSVNNNYPLSRLVNKF